MWTVRNRHFAQQFFNADDGTPGGGGGNPPETPPAKPDKVEFTPEQQRALNDLLAKERKDAEERTALRIKAEADATAEAEAEKRKNDEAAARGEFDKVRGDLEAKVSTVEGERDSAVAERDALQGYFDSQYAAALKDLPEAILAFAPADDASVETKTKWLATAQEQAGKLEKSQAAGNRPNPNPADGKFDLEAEVAKARKSGRYRA